MVELPKTQEELDALILERENKLREDLSKEYNDKFAKERTSHKAEIDKLKADMGKSADQIAEEKIREQQEKDAKELQDLRAFKKSAIIGEKLAKEGLPSFFKNDTRLLSAEDGDYDKVIKDLKKEWGEAMPKGNQHSTIVQQSGQQQPSAGDGDKAKAEFGRALKDLVG